MKRPLVLSLGLCLLASVVWSAEYADTFDRANNADLGTQWDTYTGDVALEINGNEAKYNGTADDATEGFNGATFTNDQYVSVVIGTWPAEGVQGTNVGQVGALVRGQTPGTTQSFYRCLAFVNHSVDSSIIRNLTGTSVTLVSSTAETWVTGDELKCTAVGTTITLYKNNVAVLSTTDSNLASGRTGIQVYNSVARIAGVASWQAGDIGPMKARKKVQF